MNQTFTIYTDGSARGNPGKGGYGAIIMFRNGDKIEKVTLSQGYRYTTNNRMEITGVLKALEWVTNNIGKGQTIQIYTDSQYVANSINLRWLDKWEINHWYRDRTKMSVVKNRDLWEMINSLRKDHNLSISHVAGHADNMFNIEADALAVAAATSEDESTFIEDAGYKH